ncbi:MAG: mannose-1-phosphate guanylyltransferase [Treponema sp.]|nr:mannose-1-phosphate guanylyltransferase [Treponema sp.]
MITDTIILAGGFGERLWPASSPALPKQFMTLHDGCSFFQASLYRAWSVNKNGTITVVTRKDLVATCVEHCTSLARQFSAVEREHFLQALCIVAEPCPRHTAPAILLATYLVQKKHPETNRTVLVLTSDHVIEPVEAFVADCQKAAAAAESGFLVCFAIPPTEPSTGYGYIKTGEPLFNLQHTFLIDYFKEKPDAHTAAQYLAAGNFWWNSGTFAFTAKDFDANVQLYAPNIYASFEAIRRAAVPVVQEYEGISVVETWPEMETVYSVVPAVAVDVAIMEKTNRACAVRASFHWTDVGSWDTFSSLASSHSAPRVVQIESTENFVYSDIPVALCGVDNLVVVVKNNNVLVMKKGAGALVREAAQKMQLS